MDDVTTLRLVVGTRDDARLGTRLSSVAVHRMSGSEVATMDETGLRDVISQKMKVRPPADVVQVKANAEAHNACPMDPPTAWVHNMKTRGAGASRFNLHINLICDMKVASPFAGGTYVAPSSHASVPLDALPVATGTDAWMVRIFAADAGSGVFSGDVVIM